MPVVSPYYQQRKEEEEEEELFIAKIILLGSSSYDTRADNSNFNVPQRIKFGFNYCYKERQRAQCYSRLSDIPGQPWSPAFLPGVSSQLPGSCLIDIQIGRVRPQLEWDGAGIGWHLRGLPRIAPPQAHARDFPVERYSPLVGPRAPLNLIGISHFPDSGPEEVLIILS